MLKQYCQTPVIWKPRIIGGYGTTFGTAETVKVYFEPNIKLNRGQDNTSSSDTLMVDFEYHAYGVGDYIEHSGRGYHITAVSEFYKPRSAIFDHLEVDLREINNE